MKSSVVAGCCVAVLMLSAAHAASPLPPSEARSMAVQFGDLDLSRPEGARTLRLRLMGAAAVVCDGLQGQDLKSGVRFAECRRAAFEAGLAQVYRVAGTAK